MHSVTDHIKAGGGLLIRASLQCMHAVCPGLHSSGRYLAALPLPAPRLPVQGLPTPSLPSWAAPLTANQMNRQRNDSFW